MLPWNLDVRWRPKIAASVNLIGVRKSRDIFLAKGFFKVHGGIRWRGFRENLLQIKIKGESKDGSGAVFDFQGDRAMVFSGVSATERIPWRGKHGGIKFGEEQQDFVQL